MPVIVAPEALVNTVTTGAQRPGDVAVLPGGASVVAWIDESSGAGVAKVRVYGPDGQPSGGEITVGAARDVAVAPLSTGFVVIRINEIGQPQTDIVAQRYDLLGQPVVGGQVVLDSVDFRNTPILGYRAQGLEATPLSDGGYVVGWSSASFDSSGRTHASVVYQVVGADGALEGRGANTLASGRTAAAYDANIAFGEVGGQVVATWWQAGFSEAGQQVVAGQMVQVLDLAGGALAPAVPLNRSPLPDSGPAVDGQFGLSIAGLQDDRVAVAWTFGGDVLTSVYAVGPSGALSRTTPQRVGPAGGEPEIAVLADGRYVVGWSAGGDVRAMVFTSTGLPQGAHLSLGFTTTGTQDQVQIAAGAGVILAAWRDDSGLGGDTSGSAVKLELVAVEVFTAGGAGNDTLVGNAASDRLTGLAGDDSLVGAAGDDTLDGGANGDVLVGGPGNDSLSGGSSVDYVSYEAAPSAVGVDLAANRAVGGWGLDTIAGVEAAYGSNFNDALAGDHLGNILVGGAGDDRIEGRTGSNYLEGGAGTDTLVLIGRVTAYFVTELNGDRAQLLGVYGNDRVLGFERVQLDDVNLSWTEFTGQAFNGLRYIASNPDLIAAFGASAEAGRQHWLAAGRVESRALATFDPLRYAASNPDLRLQFGSDAQALTQHWITNGFAAGRSATPFDALEYGAINPDLLFAFGPDEAAFTRHYVIAGATEARAVTGFDALLYGASNDDLARLFGADRAALLNHWVRAGVFEGRQTDTFDALQYAAANDDLARIYGTDTQGALTHYLLAGADEFRATSGFDTVAYTLSYYDEGVRPGTALNHWLTAGADAGLRGDELFGREQAGHLIQSPGTSGELKNFATNGRFTADKDWFEITISSAPVTTRVTVAGADSGRGTLAHPRLEIYDSQGRRIAVDEDSGPGRDAQYDFFGQGRPGSSITYYLVVSSADGGEGTYEIVRTSFSGAPALDEGWIV